MAGYDGHRGWVNYLAVAPASRRAGVGRALMTEVERVLGEAGARRSISRFAARTTPP